MSVARYNSRRALRIRYARELWDAGKNNNEIAVILRLNYSTVARLTRHWPPAPVAMPDNLGKTNQQRAIEVDDQPTRQPAAATSAPIGSFARVEAYRQRVERGEELWHAGDCAAVVRPTREAPRHVVGNPRVVDLRIEELEEDNG